MGKPNLAIERYLSKTDVGRWDSREQWQLEVSTALEITM